MKKRILLGETEDGREIWLVATAHIEVDGTGAADAAEIHPADAECAAVALAEIAAEVMAAPEVSMAIGAQIAWLFVGGQRIAARPGLAGGYKATGRKNSVMTADGTCGRSTGIYGGEVEP